ncbi:MULTISPECIES: tryptophan--tRNA ligase [Shewanella]|uniref:tryptophan--tRNA ligase n=1 Tax=Shewanella TaxID=22 RepID=UPI000469D260|nr:MULTISPECIES: tryptophan--tRNA ligase [Shewanella]MBO2576874.1 tryptophan--tRNA ligase [Shewanella algae]MBO2602383.1 tryptophan--tRNA ligase [Shewanella algae]MBO2610860.1 tryptophan--tRNA ligase [Shewanella algae]MBO2619219.1 tryptophan--tRNA ligase [Shewanella algae]MBO2657143.1 tryptophan--tRNA ligase [Shewanella algae]
MKQIILTGDRPTGKLHIGHYVGSLRQRVQVQDEFDQNVMIADYQALTDNGHNPAKVTDNILEVMADYLAAGLDPAKTRFCLQSALPALSELTCIYLNLVTVARLERNPTVKAEIQQKGFERSLPAGFLVYPVSQTADITAFRATHVPVGEDQLPMLEQSNEIVRRFNNLVGAEVLKECQAILSDTGRLPGLDGKAKMSKSLGNTIELGMSSDELKQAVFSMYTDPNHLRVEDPGRVEGNTVFSYLDAFHPDKALVAELKAHYRRGGLGDMKCKRILNDCLQELLAPMRERRSQAMADKGQLLAILQRGTEEARAISDAVLQDVKAAMGLNLFR